MTCFTAPEMTFTTLPAPPAGTTVMLTFVSTRKLGEVATTGVWVTPPTAKFTVAVLVMDVPDGVPAAMAVAAPASITTAAAASAKGLKMRFI